jgi:hypothetical protein
VRFGGLAKGWNSPQGAKRVSESLNGLQGLFASARLRQVAEMLSRRSRWAEEDSWGDVWEWSLTLSDARKLPYIDCSPSTLPHIVSWALAVASQWSAISWLRRSPPRRFGQ